MTIGRKIGWASAGSIGIVLALAATSLFGVAELSDDIQSLQTDSIPGQTLSARLYAAVMTVRVRMNAELLDLTTHADTLNRRQEEVAEAQRQADLALRSYQAIIATAGDRQHADAIRTSLEGCYRAWQQVRELSRTAKPEEVLAQYRHTVVPAFANLDREVVALVDSDAATSQQSVANLVGHAALTRRLSIAIGGVSVLLTLVGAFLLTRGLTRTLTQIVLELSQTARQVASAAGQVSSSGQELARGASEQAASLQETSASSEEVNITARKNSDDTAQAAGLVEQSQRSFAEANHSLDLMVAAMNDIKAQSEKISKIIKVIDEIAFQTNILALNAAVEAARAGEAGMGFAVVAEEVRSLAQRCAKAAKDITELIEESITKSHQGKDKVDRVASSVRSVSEDAVKIQHLVNQVNASSREQTRGVELVAKAVTRIQQVTQTNAASSEENAAASEELSAQAATLQNVVDRLAAQVGRSAAVSAV
ncbi:MAG: MCP four helix bundle domain-containing protein [Bryobacterales bacterium]|nr:MCP four helix bundle domain-containing protein [Bryobacterales bacterium]